MKIKTNKKSGKVTGFTITDILNESLLDDVESYARRSKCRCILSECSTKAEITGNIEQLQNFTKLWNNS